MSRLWFAPFVVVSLGFISAQVHAQSGVVQGAVVHAVTHVPVAGAQVIVAGTDLTAVTGADGSYRITGVPAGDHAVEATAPGYQRGVASCAHVPSPVDAGVAIPVLPQGYVPPPPPPPPTRPEVRPTRTRDTSRGPLLYVINGLVYPLGYEHAALNSDAGERLESLEVLHAGTAMQRYRPCSLVSGAIIMEFNLPGHSGKVVGRAVDAATDQPLSELRVGPDMARSHVEQRGGRFDWYTREATTGLALARYGYDPYLLPCRLRVPVDDSAVVLVRMSPSSNAAASATPTEPATFRDLLQPLFVVNDTIWAPGTRSPLIPAAQIASVETLPSGPARERFGQCGSSGAILVRTR